MARFTHTGNVWNLELTHQETEASEGSAAIIAGVVSAIAPPFSAVVAGALGVLGGVAMAIDAIGGDHGVEISGTIPYAGVVITPLGSGFVALLIQGAEVTLNPEATIVDFIIKVSGIKPSFAAELGLTTVASVAAAVELGTPLGAALAAATGIAGAVVNLIEGSPNPNKHGGVHADRTTIGPWETFIMAQVPPRDHVSLLSWQGLFSAEDGGGGDVFANKPKVGSWETWNMIHHNDRTHSFQSTNGHYFSALNGGGDDSTCGANRTAIGDWEKFYLTPLPKGRVALQTFLKHTYVSVQRDL